MRFAVFLAVKNLTKHSISAGSGNNVPPKVQFLYSPPVGNPVCPDQHQHYDDLRFGVMFYVTRVFASGLYYGLYQKSQ